MFSFVLILLSALSLSQVGTAQRTVLNNDFNWKFKLGNVAQEDLCPANAFPIDLTNFFCPSWAHQAAYGLSEDECRLYCCQDPWCAGYSYNNGFCAIGNSIDGCVKSNGYSGGARNVPASIPQPPANGPQNPNYDDSNWDNVTVPHDYIVFQTPSQNEESGHGYRPRNISWYRKHFTLDNSFTNKIIWLEFDGVYRSSDMWLNGNFLGHHASGYTSFRYRIDNFKGINLPGSNVLSVRIDPRTNEGWWYEGAGIYRHTSIVSTNYVHIAPWGVYVPSQVIGAITTGSNGDLLGDSLVEIYVNISNAGNTDSTVSLLYSIIRSDGSKAWVGNSETVILSSGQSANLYQKAILYQATLWDPSKPNLYELEVSLMDSSKRILDSTSTKFGIRKVQFDGNYGFFINERNVKVRGACNHQDFAGVGTAVPDRVNYFRVEKMISSGFNAWRMSHNPPNPELLDFADELGMLVWDENRFFGNFSQWFTDQADMIMRDRNHPSVIWWSLCNEWGCEQYSTNSTISAGLVFRDIVKSLDPTRPISGAWNGDLSSGSIFGTQVCDIMGINYNYGQYDPFHSEYPYFPVISSESCSCTSDRNSGANSTLGLVGPLNSWPCVRDCWQPVASRSFVMGSFDWTAFDYRGEESPTGWPCVNSHFGSIDLSGYDKDDMFYFKAWFFPNVPIAHITPQDFSGANSGLYITTCESNLRWKFNNSGSGSLIESVTNPGYCIKGALQYPAIIVPCDPRDNSFIFFTDSYGQIYYNSNNQKNCLDIFAGTGPQVGFYQCKNSPHSNQIWKYDSQSGELQSSFIQNSCVGSGINMLVYTNGDSVQLIVNGQSVGSQNIQQFNSGNFILPITVIPNNVTAIVTKNSASWAQDSVVIPGTPDSISLEIERPQNGNPIFSDGQDVALLTASVLDSKGNIVRSANNLITFVVTSGAGRIVGTGNGNPVYEYPDQGNKRPVWNGFARAIVGANLSGNSGTITVQATSPGLRSAQVQIPTKLRDGLKLI